MKLNKHQEDILIELMNIGIGEAASILNEMVSCHVDLSVPLLKHVSRTYLNEKLYTSLGHNLSLVEMQFEGAMEGRSHLLFSETSGKKLVNILADDFEEEDYNTLKSGTLIEVGNIILNSVLASFSNAMSDHLDYRVSVYTDITVDQYTSQDSCIGKIENNVFLCEVKFDAKDVKIEGQIVLMFDTDAIHKLFVSLNEAC
jgi:chemotaxis protein CheC